MNKESSISAVSSLWLRHKDAAQYYQKALDLTEDKSLRQWLESLVAYRRHLAERCEAFIEDLPPVPFTPNKKIVSGLNSRWDEIKEALIKENRSKITSLCRDGEREDYEALKESLRINSLPLGVEEFLDQQGKIMLQIQPKVERMNLIPSLSDNTFTS